jgi:DNA primase
MYYADEEQIQAVTVAIFTFEELDRDNILLNNPLHQLLIEEYKMHFDDETFNSERYFLYHPNAQLSQLAADLVTEKYTLSKVHSKVKRVESDSERLLELIPRVVYEFKNSLLLERIRGKLIELKSASDAKNNLLANEIMREMAELEEVKKQLSKNLGERIIIKI